MSEDLIKAHREMREAFEGFKANHERELAELKKSGAADPVSREATEKANTAITEMQERLKQIELKANRPRSGGADQADPAKVEHKEAFLNWMRRPADTEAKQRLALAQKAITTTSDSAGGYAVPEELDREIAQRVLDISPVRQVARVIQIGSAEYRKLVNRKGAGYGWVGEGDPRSETNTPILGEVKPTIGTIYAYPFAREEALDDIFFDVQGFLVEEVVEAFAQGEGEAFIAGNGSDKPTGFLNGTKSVQGDTDSPARPFGQLQYVFNGQASSLGQLSTSSPFFYPGDPLIDLVYSLQAFYRGNARWMWNKKTASEVRKLKDADGNYIWQPGLQAGEPASVLGYPTVEAEDMPDIGSNTFPIAFGDFQRGYLIVDRVGLRITVDDNITAPGTIKWYVRRRVGGKILDDKAIKLLKIGTS